MTTVGTLCGPDASLDAPARLDPVHAGHLVVHQDEVVGAARVGRPVQLHQGLLAAGREPDVERHRPQALGQDLARRLAVVHDQHAQAPEVADQAGEAGPRPAGPAERRREAEGAPLAGLALDPDLAPHHLDEPLADREAQAGPAELAGGRRVGLRERPEELARPARRVMPMPVSRTENSRTARSSRTSTARVGDDDLALAR